MKKKRNAGKLARALAAAVLAAGLMLPPGAALAEAGASDVAPTTFKLTSVQVGDVVTAYQVFDTTIDDRNNLVYTKKAELPEAYDTIEEISAETNVRKLADAIAAKVIATSTVKVSATADAASTAEMNLDSGYYLVVVTSNSGNTQIYQTLLVDATPAVDEEGKYVPRTIADAEAKTKEVTPPTKVIVPSGGGEGGQSTDTYSVGDTATFVIKGTIPNYPADATHAKYSITDVPDAGLGVNTSSFVVYEGMTGTTEVPASAYEVKQGEKDEKAIYTVEFTEEYILAHPGQELRIQYTATVNSVDKVTGKVGNKVYGTFAPSPYEEKYVDTDENDPWAQTYGFSFQKFGGTDDEKSPLKGAVFTVTDLAGTPVSYLDREGILHTDGKVTSDEGGWIYVNGLKAGTYTVSETTVPSGFQPIDDFTVTLNAETATGDTNATDGVTEVNFFDDGQKIDPPQGQLPQTGGAGTIALTAGGVLLVAGGAAMVLRSRKRKQD